MLRNSLSARLGEQRAICRTVVTLCFCMGVSSFGSTMADESGIAPDVPKVTELKAESEQISGSETNAPASRESAFETQRVRGKVVWLADGLKRQFGISTVPEFAENGLAVWTDDHKLLPIVENLRGRAFRKDKRLREMEVELDVRRYRDQPMVQILRVYQWDGERRLEIDYWCDVCAIVMYESGPCSCCQDDNRLRKRMVKKDGTAGAEIDPTTP